MQPRKTRLRSRSSRFIQYLGTDAFSQLSRLAKEKGIASQELIRAVVIPDWMQAEGSQPGIYLSRPRAMCRFRTQTS